MAFVIGKKKTREYLTDAVLILIGCLLISISINMFLLPNKISTGGATGIAIIIYYIYNTPISFSVFLINLPLFIIALKVLGFKFCIRALVGTAILIFLMELTSPLKDLEGFAISNDLFIGSIFGGIFSGAGLSLVFRADSSTGGSDLLANIIYKARPVSSIGFILLVIDVLVILSNIIIFKNIHIGLYSIVTLYLSKQTIDVIFQGINYTKIVNIITKKGEEISKEIISQTERGVTISECKGVYTNSEYDHVISVVTVPQIPKVKKIIKKIDQTSFVYISNTNEVLGVGFKDIKNI